MTDIYMYTSNGYVPVDPDFEPPPPVWPMIIEVLREFPRSVDTIQWGIETLHGEYLPDELIIAELDRLTTLGFIALCDSHTDAIPTYKLTPAGLVLQANNTQLCPYCETELVINGEGYHQCKACELVFFAHACEADYETYHLYTGADMLKIYTRKLPKMPQDVPVCLPVPPDWEKKK